MASRVSFDTAIQSNDQSFDRVRNAGLPVAAVFWSRALDAGLEAELNARARADAGNLLVVKIKTEDNPELVRHYRITAMPTLVTFRNGQEQSRFEYLTPTLFREAVEHLLGRGPEPRVQERKTARDGSQKTANGGERPGDRGQPLTITDASFGRDVMQANVPVVVDFWAPWCGPCRMVTPVLEKLAAEYAGRLRIAKMNVDENSYTPQMYQVQGIPTLLFVKNGRIVDRVVGALPERQLRSAVERFLGT